MDTPNTNNAENNQANNQTKTTKFNQIELITASEGFFRDVQPNQLFIVRDKIFNGKNTIKIKRPSLRVMVPAFQDGYLVDTSNYSAVIENPEYPDGKYRQDIGLGDDILLKMKISFHVSKNYRSIKNLFEQIRTYKEAIRTSSETIMRMLIKENYINDNQNNNNDFDIMKRLDDHNKIQLAPLYLNELYEKADRTPDLLTPNENNILNAADSLYNNYGIVLTRVEFTDVDLSERMKNEISTNIEDAGRRKREQAQSDLELQIAKNKAEALNAEIQKLKDAGFTSEQIAAYYSVKNIPEGAIAVMGGNNPGLVSDMTTANIASQRAYNQGSQNQDPQNQGPQNQGPRRNR